jgi:uncharacterized membrane protein
MMMAVWSFVGVALLVLVGWAIAALVRDTNRSAPPLAEAPTQAAARDLLDERLGRGDIDVDGYQQRRHALETSESASAP